MLRLAFSARSSSRLGHCERSRPNRQSPSQVLMLHGEDSKMMRRQNSTKAASANWRPLSHKPPTLYGRQQTCAGAFSVPCARGNAVVAMPKVKGEHIILLQSTNRPPPLQCRVVHQHGCHLIRPGFISYFPIVRPPLMRISQPYAFRWFGTDGKANGSKQEPVTQESSKAEKTKEDGIPATEEFGKDGGQPESLDPRTFLLGTTARIKKVADWQVGDEIATYAIAVLLGLIILGPIMGHYMRRSDNNYDEPYTDDQVVDMARIVKRDFLDKISAGEGLEDKGVVHSVIADVLSSKSLQEQAVKFVVTIVSSEEVKAVCQRLLQDLWNDLIKDPETTAQVISLLNAAIQNEDIRLAVKNLVLEIVEDEEVLEELVRLLQKLGQDQDVLDATKTLLTESTHNALNDPQILDHSMEFAADVVGDDVVQRTAGEALRNTLSYAVQPGMSIILAATGVGLLFFSVVSLGYARSSEQDAKVLDQAVSGLARSLQPSPRLTDRLWNIIAIPFRVVSTAAGAMFTTVLLPFQIVQVAVARTEYTGRAVNKAALVSTTWLVGNCRDTMSWVNGGATAVSSSMTYYWAAIISFVLAPLSWFDGSMTGRLSNGLDQYWRSLPRDTVAWAWVSLDSVSRVFRFCRCYLESFSMPVTGKGAA